VERRRRGGTRVAVAGLALVALVGAALPVGPAPPSATLAYVGPSLGGYSGPAPAPTSGPPAGPDDSRRGGTEPGPAPGKPGWVWWVAVAFLAVVAVGSVRLWRSMGAEPPDDRFRVNG
jgi:hypothetical protein